MARTFRCHSCLGTFGSDRRESMCPSCRQEEAEAAEFEWDSLRNKVAQAMNERNREKFLNMETSLQRGLMLKMLEDDIVSFEIA